MIKVLVKMASLCQQELVLLVLISCQIMVDEPWEVVVGHF